MLIEGHRRRGRGYIYVRCLWLCAPVLLFVRSFVHSASFIGHVYGIILHKRGKILYQTHLKPTKKTKHSTTALPDMPKVFHRSNVQEQRNKKFTHSLSIILNDLELVAAVVSISHWLRLSLFFLSLLSLSLLPFHGHIAYGIYCNTKCAPASERMKSSNVYIV